MWRRQKNLECIDHKMVEAACLHLCLLKNEAGSRRRAGVKLQVSENNRTSQATCVHHGNPGRSLISIHPLLLPSVVEVKTAVSQRGERIIKSSERLFHHHSSRKQDVRTSVSSLLRCAPQQLADSALLTNQSCLANLFSLSKSTFSQLNPFVLVSRPLC